jgi:hypothetical protein
MCCIIRSLLRNGLSSPPGPGEEVGQYEIVKKCFSFLNLLLIQPNQIYFVALATEIRTFRRMILFIATNFEVATLPCTHLNFSTHFVQKNVLADFAFTCKKMLQLPSRKTSGNSTCHNQDPGGIFSSSGST